MGYNGDNVVEGRGNALLRQCEAGDWLALSRMGASHSESMCNCFWVTTTMYSRVQKVYSHNNDKQTLPLKISHY